MSFGVKAPLPSKSRVTTRFDAVRSASFTSTSILKTFLSVGAVKKTVWCVGALVVGGRLPQGKKVHIKPAKNFCMSPPTRPARVSDRRAIFQAKREITTDDGHGPFSALHERAPQGQSG